MELRPYQIAACEAIHRQWRSGIRKTLLILPTGTGKTIVFARVIADLVGRGERVLILAHREELLAQAADKLRRATGLGAALQVAAPEYGRNGLFLNGGGVFVTLLFDGAQQGRGES